VPKIAKNNKDVQSEGLWGNMQETAVFHSQGTRRSNAAFFYARSGATHAVNFHAGTFTGDPGYWPYACSCARWSWRWWRSARSCGRRSNLAGIQSSGIQPRRKDGLG